MEQRDRLEFVQVSASPTPSDLNGTAMTSGRHSAARPASLRAAPKHGSEEESGKQVCTCLLDAEIEELAA
jgi:hypothetical protein